MYFNNYDDYMRNILGYDRNNMNCCYDGCNNQYAGDTYNCYGNMNDRVLSAMEELYPEIYKRINPMVCRMCQNITLPITSEMIEQMTDKIYTNINVDDINIVNINVETRDTNQPKQVISKQTDNREVKELKQDVRDNKNYQESRSSRPNNPLLRDLIRILLLNQLIRRPAPRPPFPGPGMGPRPPFPGPGPRPTPWNRDYIEADYYNY